MQIAEFFATLGMKIDETQWNAASSKIKDFKKDFLSLRTAILAGTVGLFLFEGQIGKMGARLANTSQILQVPIQSLQALKLAAKEAAVPFQDVQSGIGSLQTALANYRSGIGLPENLQMGLAMLRRATGQSINPNDFKSGYDLSKKVFQLLGKVQGTQRKEGILNQIFGNSNMLPLFANGMDKVNKALSQLKARGLIFNPQDIAAAKEFNGQMALLKTEVENLGAKVGMKLLPTFQAFVKEMNDLAKNKDFVQGLEDIGKAILYVAKALAWVIEEIGKVGKVFQGPNVKVTGSASPMTLLNYFTKKKAADSSVSNNNSSSKTTNTTNHTVNNVKNTTVHTHNSLEYLTSHVTGGFR